MVDNQISLLIDTILDKHGITVDISSGEHAVSGFIVALEGSSLTVPSAEFFDQGSNIIAAYIEQHEQSLSSKDNHLGIWHNTEQSVVVLDIVERLTSRAEVLRLATERNQYAVYDLSREQVIRT